MRGILSTSDTRIVIWLLVVMVLLYISTAKGVLEYGDDIQMLNVTVGLVDRGGVDVPSNTPGVRKAPNGLFYSLTGIGQSVLAVPFFAVGKGAAQIIPSGNIIDAEGNPRSGTAIYIVMMLGMICSAATVALLFLTSRALGFANLESVLAALSLGIGSFAWHYSRTFMSEPASMLSILAAFYFLLRFRKERSTRWILLSGAAASFAIMMRLTNSIAILPFGIWLLSMAWVPGRHGSVRSAIRAGILWSIPILLGIAIIAFYNFIRFGTVFETGYGSPPFDVPLFVGLWGLLLSPGKSVFIYSPMLIASIFGWLRLRKTHPDVTAAAAVSLGVYVLLYSKFHYWWGGGVWGPRFLAVVLPLAMIGICALPWRAFSTGWKLFVGLLASASVFIQIASVLVPYVPYEAQMEATQQLFDQFLWNPAYSPVLITILSLLEGKYLWDIAPNYYASDFLLYFQISAFLAFTVVLILGLFPITRRETERSHHKSDVKIALRSSKES